MAQERVEFPITGTVISVNVKVGDEVKELRAGYQQVRYSFDQSAVEV